MQSQPDRRFRSPILRIAAHVPESVVRGAPERAAEVRTFIEDHRIVFVLDDRPGFIFRALRTAAGVNEVRASVAGLDVLWCLSYAHLVLYNAYNAASTNGATSSDFSDHPDTKAAAELLEWAMARAMGAEDPWPDDLPQPVSDDVEATLETAAATEVFLCSTAWAFHHELAHHGFGHLRKPLVEIEDERSADASATAFILDAVPSDARIRTKRGLGIAIALLALNTLGLRGGEPEEQGMPRTHPRPAERLITALNHPAFDDNHQVIDFAVVALSLRLQALGLTPSLAQHDTRRGDLAALCVAAITFLRTT